MISIETVQTLIDYHPNGGYFTWRKRDRDMFKGDRYWKSWHTKFMGKKLYGAKGRRHVINFNGEYIAAARVAWMWMWMTGTVPDNVDHIDGDCTNNTWENLRSVTHKENIRNSKRFSTNQSGATGVCAVRRGRWRAYIVVDHKQVSLGGLLTSIVQFKREKLPR